MKLLLDANISWRLMSRLQPHFDECHHVDFIGLTVPAKDIEIWNYAFTNQFIIVTNDEDFLNLIATKGFPPKIILLKTGNQSNLYIESLLIEYKEEIQKLYLSKEYGVLQLF